MRFRCLFPLTLILPLLMAGIALADGLFLDGLAPRSIARGGTNIAHSDNSAILYDNPAGAVNVEGQGLFDVGADLMLTDFGYGDPDNPMQRDLEVSPLVQMGYIRKSADDQWAVGIGFFVPAGFQEKYDLQGPYPLLGEQRYKSFGALMKVLPGVSYRLTDRLSVGATLGVGVSHVEIEGPYFIQGPSLLAGTPTLMDVQATGATPVYSFGLQYDLTDRTTVGLCYQSESRFELHGSTRVSVPLLGETRYDTALDVTWPRSLGLGVRHELCPHRIVSVDVIWSDWSSAFDDFGLALSRSTNPLFPSLVEQFPLRWHDTVSTRLGFERVFCGGQVFRCGYVYHRSPVNDGTLTPFVQAALEHGFSVGYGRQWLGLEWDLTYMYSFGPAHNVGTSTLLGGDFDGSRHTSQSHCIAIGVQKRF